MIENTYAHQKEKKKKKVGDLRDLRDLRDFRDLRVIVSILLVSYYYFLWSGALDSSDVLLSHPLTSSILDMTTILTPPLLKYFKQEELKKGEKPFDHVFEAARSRFVLCPSGALICRDRDCYIFIS